MAITSLTGGGEWEGVGKGCEWVGGGGPYKTLTQRPDNIKHSSQSALRLKGGGAPIVKLQMGFLEQFSWTGLYILQTTTLQNQLNMHNAKLYLEK